MGNDQLVCHKFIVALWSARGRLPELNPLDCSGVVFVPAAAQNWEGTRTTILSYGANEQQFLKANS